MDVSKFELQYIIVIFISNTPMLALGIRGIHVRLRNGSVGLASSSCGGASHATPAC
jgi:hypothetical protein